MKYKSGEDFLNRLYKDMHMSEIVMHTAEKSDTPPEKINKYMERLEKAHEMASSSTHKMEHLKRFYHNKYVIKEVPENYIVLQKRIAREEGRGDIKITKKLKEQMLTTIQSDQKSSLDSWIDYLSSDDAMYPMWFKYYAFKEMLKLGKFDKETGTFGKRTSKTADTFIELNPEILAQVYDMLSKEIQTETPTQSEEEAFIQGESFKKLYTFYFQKSGVMEEKKETDGKWIKYEQGNDYLPLWESLQGKNTGWCTAGKATAKKQLENGDFYVYYTKDENNEYTNPRIAIRMDGQNKIGEVRGIGKKQNLEGNMVEIARHKLDEFPDADKYRKKVSDMRRLTEIEKKDQNSIELTKEELTFLYELESKIEGFGYQRDPRIDEIKVRRNMNKDFITIYDFDCSEDQLATRLGDFDYKDVVVYLGDLDLDIDVKTFVPSNFSNLKIITGNVRFSGIYDVTNLSSLQSIGGDAYFGSLRDASGLNNLQTIGRNANFGSLRDASGLNNLQTIGGRANFGSLRDAKGLNSLQSIGGSAILYSLVDAKGLNSLQSIGESANFDSLRDAKGLNSLQSIGENAILYSLVDAKGLNSLQSIGGIANFNSLRDARGLNNLQTIGEDVYFGSLRDASALKNCNKYEEIKKQADMNAMISENEVSNNSTNNSFNQKL